MNLESGSHRSGHQCHALGCKAACPPRHLMCAPHWAKVPREIQDEVYRTVRIRGPRVSASWAPWWRAQAQAIAFVAHAECPNETKRDRYLRRELDFANHLESRGVGTVP